MAKLFITIGVSALALASTAHAQDASPDTAQAGAMQADDRTEGNDIVVTAQRRVERLQDVPVSVSVVSGEKIATQGLVSLNDVAARVPNLSIARNAAADQIHIRGTGSGINGGFEQSVATFVDGLYRSRAHSVGVALFDIERVEVLKGPQTTFFGANAIAGALNITTKRPGQDFAGNVLALYSPTDGEYKLEGGVTTPLSDKVSLRVAGQLSGMDGYIKNPRGGDGPNTKNKLGRISLTAQPSDSIDLFARFDAAKLRGKGTYNGEVLNCPQVGVPVAGLCAAALPTGLVDNRLDYHAIGAMSGRFRLNMYEGLFSARIQLPAFDLISTTGYIDQYARATSDLAAFPGATVNGTQSFVPVNPGEYYKQFSQELRLDSTTDGPIKYMIGGYYEHNHLKNDVLSGIFFANQAARIPAFVPLGTAVGIRWLTRQKTETLSGFGSVSYDITDQFVASAGLRYSSVQKRASRQVDFGYGGRLFLSPSDFVALPEAAQAVLGLASRAPFAKPSRTDDKWMPSVNIRYKVNRDVNLYASYSKGFKAGGYGYVQPDSFDPETVDAFEIGLKASWWDHRLTTNIALFRSDYKNLQEAQSTTNNAGVPILIIGNAAESRATGVEFSSSLQLTRALRLFADIAYLDSHYVSFPNGTCTPFQAFGRPNCVSNLSGERRPFSPKWSGNIGADLSLPLSSALKLNLGGLVYFKTSYFHEAVSDPLLREPAHTLIDLRAGIGSADDRWEIAVIGKNLTDVTSADRRTNTSGSAGSITAVAARPLSVAIQGSIRF